MSPATPGEHATALGEVTGHEPPPRRSPLERLTPWHLLTGPTFQREMRVAGRKRSTYAIRAVYVLLALGLIALVYGGMVEEMRGVRDAAIAQQFQAIAPAVALGIVWFQFVVLSMYAPSITAGAISDEKRARTLPALMTTPLSAAEIVTGKLSARIVLLLVLTASAAPILLAVRVFGGLDAQLTMLALSLGFSNAILGAALGLVLSVGAKRASRASNSAFGALALVNLGPMLLMFGLFRLGEDPNPAYFVPFSAPACLTLLSGQIMGAGGVSWRGIDPVQSSLINLGITLSLAVLATAWATLRLRAVMRHEGVIQTDESGRKRRHWLARLWSAATRRAPQPRERATSRRVSEWPILWRELRVKAFKSWTQLAMVVLVVGSVIGFVFWRAGIYEPDGHAVFAMILLLTTLASAVFAATGSIPGEREADNWSTLLTTPASPRAILYGKFFGSLRRQWFPPTVLLITLLGVGVLPQAVRPIAALQAAMILLGAVWLLTATGLVFGLLAKRGAIANAMNLLLAAGLWIGLPILVAIANGLFRHLDGPTQRVLERATDVVSMGINPVVQLGSAMSQAIVRGGAAQWPTVASHRLPGSGDMLELWEFTAMIALCTACFILLGVAIMELAIRRFNRITGRTS